VAAAVELSGNPAIGLNMGGGTPGVVPCGRLCADVQRTLAEGFKRLVRYQRIIAESADLSFACWMEVCADSDGARRSFAAHSAKRRSLAGLRPGAVRLADRAPLQPRKVLVRAINRRISNRINRRSTRRWCSTHLDALMFERADMEAPLPTANEAMALLHDRFAGEYLARFSESRVTHKARQVLCRMLPQGEPSATPWRRPCTCRSAPCGACRTRAPVSRTCSTTPPRTGRAVSGAAGHHLAGNRLPAGLCRSE
jgi:hypothetical protein